MKTRIFCWLIVLSGMWLVQAHAATTVYLNCCAYGSESKGGASVRVSRSGDSNVDSNVAFHRDGTATAGKDYVGFTQSVHFAAFEQEKRIDVSILPDDVFDPEETFEIVLTGTAGVESVGHPLLSRFESPNSAFPLMVSDACPMAPSQSRSTTTGAQTLFSKPQLI